MVPLDRRKLIYTLLTAAFLLNSGLALYDNNLTGTPGRIVRDLIGPGDGPFPFDLGMIDAGSMFTSTLDANVSVLKGSDAGYYHLEATSENSLYGDAYRQRTLGEFTLSYLSQTAPPLSLTGSLDRTRVISLDGKVSAKVDTLATIDGPSGSALPGSRSSVEMMDHAGTWSDMAWMRLIGLAGDILGNESGSGDIDLSLDEVGVSIAKAPVQWNARTVDGELWIELESTVQDLKVEAVFEEGVPWPRSYALDCSGTYLSEEGEVQFDLSMSCMLTGSILGSGAPIPWETIIRDPQGETFAVATPVGTMLSEGGDSSLRFTPQQALDKARGMSGGLSSFMDEPGVTFSSMSYYSNGSRGLEEVVWNITLTSNRDAPEGNRFYQFSVAVPQVGGRMDLNRFSLIYEDSGYRSSSAEPGRPIVSLYDHERALSGCRLADMFISTGGYSSSYQLHIIDRAAFGTSARSTLLSNIQGVGGSRGDDVFISYAEDPWDHKTVHLVLIDGRSGSVSSLVTLTGSLSPYGAIPA